MYVIRVYYPSWQMDQSGVLSLHINPLIDMSLHIWSKGMEFFHQINRLLGLRYSDAQWN